MFDLVWERSIPLAEVTREDIADIVSGFDNECRVLAFQVIQIGCRNSNMKVVTDKGDYLLRISPVNDLNNEVNVYELIFASIPVPKLYYHEKKNKSDLFIYQFIQGESLQKHIIEKNGCEADVIEQVAKAAAVIHSIPLKDCQSLKQYDVPPFLSWYNLFIDNSTTAQKLGKERCCELKDLIKKNHEKIKEIDQYTSLLHCDFRPANMLLDENKKVVFVDWESASIGHSLADIGQFFRYRQFFHKQDFELFEEVYNRNAIRRLPKDWVELSLLRDLVNPLQMLSSVQKMPQKEQDLLQLVDQTIEYFKNKS